MCSTRQVRLSLDKDAFHLSRRFAYASVAAGVGANSAVADDVALVVNELVTASYLAEAGAVDVGIDVHWDHVAVIVRDDRPRPSVVQRNETREELLDAITTERSTFDDRQGTVCMARIACSPVSTKRVSCADRPWAERTPRAYLSAPRSWTVRAVPAAVALV